MLPKILSLVSMVLLILWMFYFLAGGLPLLILKHADPSDSRFVRGFFNIHYLVLMNLAALGAISALLAERQSVAAAAACIAVVALSARMTIVRRMDRLRAVVVETGAPAAGSFRRLQVTGLALNVVMFAGFVTVLNVASAEIVTCAEQPPGCVGAACRVICSLL